MTRARIFRLLLVCSGNQCRSPAAERLLAGLLVESRGSSFELDSAGTRARDGLAIHPLTARCLVRRGVPVDGHRSRSVRSLDVQRADVILTAEARHRSTIVDLDGQAVHRTFTLLEFAGLAPTALEAGVIDPWELIEAAALARGRMAASTVQKPDLPDPVNGRLAEHEAVVTAIQRCATSIAVCLHAVSASGAPIAGSRARQVRPVPFPPGAMSSAQPASDVKAMLFGRAGTRGGPE